MVMLENAVLEFCALGWKKGSRISTLLAGLNGYCTVFDISLNILPIMRGILCWLNIVGSNKIEKFTA